MSSEPNAEGVARRQLDINALDWEKGAGLLPAVIQDATSGAVLMVGYMNREALERTVRESRVVFYSRTKARLWMKGETSDHFLDVVDIAIDCDRDTLLITAKPRGPTCHTGQASCFAPAQNPAAVEIGFLARLEGVIDERSADPKASSYTAKLLAEGPLRIAQKIGEEGVEVALAAATGDDAGVIAESADLVYHLLVMLKSRGLSLRDVARELESRHRN